MPVTLSPDAQVLRKLHRVQPEPAHHVNPFLEVDAAFETVLFAALGVECVGEVKEASGSVQVVSLDAANHRPVEPHGVPG
ncbi:hypothetical protein AB6V29_14530 [Microbacterium sp. 20-116]|uniref:hypothetical protein n=1 Tax=Microbacterium sp. 20-116 TaxID=3239883 RepID=UPI0034E1B1FD